MKLFRDLFRPKKLERISSAAAVETAPVSVDQVESKTLPLAAKRNPPQLVVGIAQSVGMQRDHNEDTLYAMHSIFADGTNDLPFGIFIVADGMGGHLNGEIASGAAARTVGDYLLTKFYVPLLAGQNTFEQENESIHEVMENAVSEAQKAVLLNAPGGGTTLTSVVVLGDKVTISHVGDSRAYFLYPDGRIQVMTQDHSLVRRLQDLGQIDEYEASVHPQRNVLYRALGQNEPFRPDIQTQPMPNPGYLMLCSDGLWGSVPDADIFRIVDAAADPATACQNLIDAANEAGGPDNISVILVRYLS